MKYALENGREVFEEMLPLLQEHWSEIAHYKDIPLEPDLEAYFKMQDIGMLRVFTARDESNALIGYAVFFIKHSMHYKSSLQALQDILFIRKDARGSGAKFILWCDNQLRQEGVQVVAQHIKNATPHTIDLMKRLGYTVMDIILTKRLDKPQGG